MIVAGCISGSGEDNAWLLHTAQFVVEQPVDYYSNAEEADSRMWRHAVQCQANVVLIYSPDTDEYNIGFSHFNQHPKVTYIVQLNLMFRTVMKRDPEFGNLLQDKLCQIFQTLFVSSGCDYISYLKFIGKATTLNNFFQFSSFICGRNMVGCLHQTSDNKQSGFLSFIRLVGTCYFKKYATAFVALYKTPLHLYNSSLQPEERHRIWLNTIREVVSDRIISVKRTGCPPCITSLWRHWLRCCWVSQIWQNSNNANIFASLSPPQDSGWIL